MLNLKFQLIDGSHFISNYSHIKNVLIKKQNELTHSYRLIKYLERKIHRDKTVITILLTLIFD